MKLPVGVKICVNKRTYRGECPDKLVSEKSKKVIEAHEKRVSSGISKNKDFQNAVAKKEAAKEAKKAADKAAIESAANDAPEKNDKTPEKTPSGEGGKRK